MCIWVTLCTLLYFSCVRPSVLFATSDDASCVVLCSRNRQRHSSVQGVCVEETDETFCFGTERSAKTRANPFIIFPAADSSRRSRSRALWHPNITHLSLLLLPLTPLHTYARALYLFSSYSCSAFASCCVLAGKSHYHNTQVIPRPLHAPVTVCTWLIF